MTTRFGLRQMLTIMVQMACKHVWSFLLLGFAATLAAHHLVAQGAYNRLSLEVVDQTGAWIPHAHIKILDIALGAIDEMDTDASGRAEFLLSQRGQYKATIDAKGFKRYAQTFKLESNIARAVILMVADSGSGYPTVEARIRPEYLPVTIEIPQEPLELLPLPARPIRHSHRRWL